MTLGLSNIIKGIGGTPEFSRFVGFVGGLSYIVGAHLFTAWNMIEGRAFDLVAYSLAFPAGLAAVTTGTAAAVAIKDRSVAKNTPTQGVSDVP